MKKIYIREYYSERDDWGGPLRKKFVLEVDSLEEAKSWILEAVKNWEKDGVNKIYSIVECDEVEYNIETVLKQVDRPKGQPK